MEPPFKHARPRGSIAFIKRVKPYMRSLALFSDPDAYADYVSKTNGMGKQYVTPEGSGQCFAHKASKRCAIYVRANAAPGTLAHEVVHFVLALFDEIGLVVNHDSSEAVTYLVQEIVDEFTPALYDVRQARRK
jgi:hypothetical protein